MNRWNDPIREFNADVAAITAAGVDFPASFVALRDRYAHFAAMKTPCRDRLRDYMLNPTGEEDVELLRAAALIEQDSQAQVARLNSAVQHWAHQRLKEIAGAVAAENYTLIAKKFDLAAKAFSSAAKVVDVEAAAAELITAPDRERKAWVEAAVVAQDLTQTVGLLAAAARLCNVRIRDDAALLPLVCDPGDVTGRQAWAAWYSTGRCGRWAAMLNAGISIRAAKLDGFTPYPKSVDDTGEQQLDPIDNPHRDDGMVAV